MTETLAKRRVLLVIGGGIAAYKALDLIRRLRERGASVCPVLTAGAQEFVTPLAAAALAGRAGADRPVRPGLRSRDRPHQARPSGGCRGGGARHRQPDGPDGRRTCRRPRDHDPAGHDPADPDRAGHERADVGASGHAPQPRDPGGRRRARSSARTPAGWPSPNPARAAWPSPTRSPTRWSGCWGWTARRGPWPAGACSSPPGPPTSRSIRSATSPIAPPAARATPSRPRPPRPAPP